MLCFVCGLIFALFVIRLSRNSIRLNQSALKSFLIIVIFLISFAHSCRHAASLIVCALSMCIQQNAQSIAIAHFYCLSVYQVVMLCCCFRFRIPRTKQEIEADYQRRVIAKSFRERLRNIKNSEMDNMNLQQGKWFRVSRNSWVVWNGFRVCLFSA